MTGIGQFLAAFVLAAAVLLSGCREEIPGPSANSSNQGSAAVEIEPVVWPPDDRRTQQFAGSHSCRECHQEIADRYSLHPMAQSTRPTAEFPDDAFARTDQFERGGRTYTVTTNGDDLVHAEFVLNDLSEKIISQSTSVDFGIGSGKRGYTFLTNHEGILLQSPLTWYTGGHRWDLSPGYQASSHPGFERRMSDGCIACHIGRANVADHGLNRFGTPPFTECAIGCERCHGAGQAHIAHQRSGDTAGNDPIVNPDKLSLAARESVCYQCHLHGKTRILRPRRSEYDFRPGDLLSDIWVVFTEGTGIDRSGQTGAVSQVEQIVVSKCFVSSKGAFGCISCHDPHGVPQTGNEISYYRSRCLECHLSPNQECGIPEATRRKKNPEDSCIACHMPRLAANDVPHTSQTDHRILKRPEKLSATSRLSANGHTSFMPQLFPLPRSEVQRAYGLMYSEQSWSTASTELADASDRMLSPLIDSSPNDIPLLDAHAGNLLRLGELDAGIETIQKLLKIDPENESLLELLSIGLEASGDSEAALAVVDEYLERNRWNSQVLARRASLLNSLGRREEAMAAATEALAWNPWLHPTRQLLVKLAEAIGDSQLADRQQRILESLISVGSGRQGGETN